MKRIALLLSLLLPGWAMAQPPQRIVSLAPSLTEILFAVGAGERVVGVTDYCRYPAAAARLPKVGGYYDVNYERLLALRPDLVVYIPSEGAQKERLGALGIPLLELDQIDSIERIVASVVTLGDAVGVAAKGGELAADLRRKVAALKRRTEGAKRPNILISVGRSVGSGPVKQIFAAAADTFYDDLISLSGGKNAYTGNGAFPIIGGEGLRATDPDLILDLIPYLAEAGIEPSAALAEWEAIRGISLPEKTRVVIVEAGDAVIPGPRFIDFAERLAALLHPEATR
jgi:iron complex transport system substrate-binding protein